MEKMGLERQLAEFLEFHVGIFLDGVRFLWDLSYSIPGKMCAGSVYFV